QNTRRHTLQEATREEGKGEEWREEVRRRRWRRGRPQRRRLEKMPPPPSTTTSTTARSSCSTDASRDGEAGCEDGDGDVLDEHARTRITRATATPGEGTSTTPPPPPATRKNPSYDLEGYFDLDCTKVDFNDKYNYNN
ncbi:unnamed protein product, partial [Urochloa humidicola]